jgi:peptidylprolyl isomerase
MKKRTKSFMTAFALGGMLCSGLAQGRCKQEPAITKQEAPQDKKVQTTPVTRTKKQLVDTSKRITMPSGWSYEIITAAPTGAKSPQNGQQVFVHYTGWLDNKGKEGKKFDSSVDRGEKFKFYLGRGAVIRGWDEAVLNMKIGEKIRVYLPSNLAYGNRGAGNIIPPNAALIFDIELFEAQ